MVTSLTVCFLKDAWESQTRLPRIHNMWQIVSQSSEHQRMGENSRKKRASKHGEEVIKPDICEAIRGGRRTQFQGISRNSRRAAGGRSAPLASLAPRRVRDSRASEHVAECKSVVRASEHGQSVARASPIAIAWTEQSVHRASPIARASPEHRQSVARARERSQNIAKASPERYTTVARASQSSRRRAPPPSARGGRRARGGAGG